MKRLLSLALAVLMLCTLFTVNAFADTTTVIGPRDELATGADGKTDFEDTSSSGTVSVNVTTVTHKYSVDITYSNMEYALPSLTWDPSALEYVAGASDFDDKVTITLQNYSDLPVYATASFAYASGYDNAKGFGFAFDATYTDVEIGAATIGAAGAPVNFTGGLTGFDTPEKISNAVNYYKSLGSETITIGTYTVTVSKDNV